MSNVNKVSKNNVSYNLEDSRLYILDLGDVTSLIHDDAFQTTIPLASLQAFINAENAIVKFTNEGMPASATKIAGISYVNDGETYYQAMASFFMQGEENSYATCTIQMSGSTESQTAQVAGFMFNQTIPTSGGGSGGGATILEETIIDEQDGMLIFQPSADDYTAWTTEDNVILKITNESDVYYVPKTADEDITYGCSWGEGFMNMAIIMEEGGSYMGVLFSMPFDPVNLYKHEVDVSVTLGGVPSSTASFVIFTNEEEEFKSMSDVMDVLKGDKSGYNLNAYFNFNDGTNYFTQQVAGIFVGYYNNDNISQILLYQNPSQSAPARIDSSAFTFNSDVVSQIHN